jgi:Tfp pilus assembly PilM family ATPase
MLRVKSTSSAIIGLCLTDTETQAVELSLEHTAVPSLLAIAEWRGGLQETPPETVQRLLAFVRANAVDATRVAVTLDTAALFAHVLPVPAGQDESLMRKHAQWDIAQYFPDAPEGEFITDIHLLGSQPNAETQRLLSVSVRKPFARALSDALKGEGFALHVLDGDQFSAEHYLLSRQPDGDAGLVFLMGLKRERMDVSVLQDGILVNYFAREGCTTESVAAAITECTNEHGQPRRVFFFGPHATPALIEPLHTNGGLGMEILNPFAGMEVLPDNPLAVHFLKASNRFVPAVGAALRED